MIILNPHSFAPKEQLNLLCLAACASNTYQYETKVGESYWWTASLPPSTRPSAPPSASLIPAFPASPFCKFLNSAQDAQSINKTLSPPLGASAEEATQEPAGLPSKAASVVAPRNANRFGNRQNRDGLGGVWKADNRNSPIMLMGRGKPVRNWRATKGNASHS